MPAWKDPIKTVALTLKPIGDFLEVAEVLQRVPRDLLPLAKHRHPWTGYLAFEGEVRMVGMCAFKEEPGDRKEVEIAYFTLPEYEQRGIATEMARALVTIAAESAEVEAVLAHTLRKQNASARICRRLGFVLKGAVEDPEDGLVWEWRIRV